jgi:cell division initiation protein
LETRVSPKDIESRRFTVSVRGYDVEEVNDFLAAVAESHRAALDAIETLETSRRPENPYASLGDEVTQVLSTARAAASQVTAEAEQEADDLRRRSREELQRAIELREQAEEEATALLADARETVDAAQQNLGRSRQQLGEMRSQIRQERESLRQTVEVYVTTVREVRRDSADATLGTTTLLNELVARVQELEGVEEGLVQRLENASDILTTLNDEHLPSDDARVDT